MKNYIGVKIISAKPMTRGEHSVSKGYDKVLEGKAEDKGYQVVYPDGYESWSPLDAFNKAYLETTCYDEGLTSKEVSKDYQIRVCNEYDELHNKIAKLELYLKSNTDDLLSLQVKFMIGYAVVLGQRIEQF